MDEKMRAVDLLSTMDAKVWAKEFMRLYENNKLRPINVPDWVDEALMIGWFANAIMTGYDKGKAQSHQEKAPEATEGEIAEAIKDFEEKMNRENSVYNNEHLATALHKEFEIKRRGK